MLKINKPTNTEEEARLISTLKNTLPKGFKVSMIKCSGDDYKVYLEDTGCECKYSSGLVYIHNIDTLRQQFEGELQENIETPDWVDGRKGFSTTLYRGSFTYDVDSVTKTGRNAFDFTKPDPSHCLFKVNWGGANSKSTGFVTPAEFEDNLIYLRRAESRGGKRGITYAIINEALLNELEETK